MIVRMVESLLAERLVTELGLLSIAQQACTSAGIEGREQQVAYCAIVLAGKRDPARSRRGAPAEQTYRMDPEAHDFPARLQARCREIAKNLRIWGPTYEAIHDEADHYEITTLRRMVGAVRGDDIVEDLATKLTAVLAGGPRLDEMSVELAREEGAAPNDYVFQRPLRNWVRTAVIRDLGPRSQALDDHAGRLVREDAVDEELAAMEGEAADRLELCTRAIAQLRETRGLLAEAIDRADAFEARLARLQSSRRQDRDLLIRIRAALLYEADWLQREHRAVDNVLAYVTLAMRRAPLLQRVAVLSLRLEHIDRRASEVLARGMRQALEDERHPTPVLVHRTQLAAEAAAREVADGLRRVAVVPRTRWKALADLRAQPARRGAALAPVAQMLDELPKSIADDGEIAVQEETTVTIVTTYRANAIAELTAVDAVFGRVFRRYAGRPR